jgi:hypothetical protein
MKAFNLFRKHSLTISLAVLSLFMLASCSKNDDGGAYVPTAGLMAFNLAPDRPAVSFTLGSSQFGSTLGYTSYTGSYLPINVGTRQVRAYDVNNGQTLATTTFTFADSSLFSTFLVGYNGVYRTVISTDNGPNVTATPGKAWIRYVHAVADTSARPNVTIAGMTDQAAFGTVSDFMSVDAGSVTVTISSAANFEATRTLTLEENKVYTVLFVGIPGNTDPQLEPQVKFIVNGVAD